jgi:hypothetical protein
LVHEKICEKESGKRKCGKRFEALEAYELMALLVCEIAEKLWGWE